VVGVIGDFKNSGLAAPAEPQILGLYAQHSLVNYGFKEIVIRTASEPHLLAPEIAHQLHQLDPNMPFAEVQTIDELVDDLTGEQRFTTVLLALFALAGLALAVVGVYGVISYLVAQRTREMAIRLAIGARPSSIFLLVLRQGMRITLIGAMVGLLGALAASRLMSGLLFEISPADPLTFAGGAVFLLMVALMASAIPGARAMRIHIVGALGQE
jgi:ABC-type antimicrobial peptide transport system permease subunit